MRMTSKPWNEPKSASNTLRAIESRAMKMKTRAKTMMGAKNDDDTSHDIGSDLALLDTFFEVFSGVIFGGALPRICCKWAFIWKGDGKWASSSVSDNLNIKISKCFRSVKCPTLA
jgi:hypothetical protein